MSTHKHHIPTVPTNIITGFLGVGKTSAILHLMQRKPAQERWAVLVNEFGEIGVDGGLFQGKHPASQQVFIREVPGGCMCCAAGLPMQVALNQLLQKAKPDRLLIEPTGLGHPKEVLEVLSSTFYRDVLRLQRTLTLVDARTLTDSRYTSHDTFNQQIAIADVVIGNKQDLYQDDDRSNLIDYVAQHGQPETPVLFTQHGDIALSVLEELGAGLLPQDKGCGHHDHHHDHDHGHQHAHHHHDHDHDHEPKPLASELPMPECGFIKAMNTGEGFCSTGWRFASDKVFDRSKLFALLTGLQVERMKAIFTTDAGVFGYNLTKDALTEMPLEECVESRIEVIAKTAYDVLEEQLLACVI